MVICLERGTNLHMAQLMPLPLTLSCFSKILIGFAFCYRLTWVVPVKGPLNGCARTELITFAYHNHQATTTSKMQIQITGKVVGIELNELATVEAPFTNDFIKVVIVRQRAFDDTEMTTVEPVLTDNTLQHHVVHGVVGVRVWPAACAVHSVEVLIVHVVIVQRRLTIQYNINIYSKHMCGIKVKDRFPSKELREDRLGIDDIALVLQQNRLHWYGHLL